MLFISLIPVWMLMRESDEGSRAHFEVKDLRLYFRKTKYLEKRV